MASPPLAVGTEGQPGVRTLVSTSPYTLTMPEGRPEIPDDRYDLPDQGVGLLSGLQEPVRHVVLVHRNVRLATRGSGGCTSFR